MGAGLPLTVLLALGYYSLYCAALFSLNKRGLILLKPYMPYLVDIHGRPDFF